MRQKSPFFMLLWFFVIYATDAYTQNIIFTYDAAGNRESVDFISLKATNVSDSSRLIKKKFLDKSEIIISPNPNGGVFGVTVLNAENESLIKILLFDVNGKMIYRKDNCKTYTRIDISQYNNGIYFLDVIIGDRKETWKIIKE